MAPTVTQEPLCTRIGRAQALLRLPAPILVRLTQNAPLSIALTPFRRKPFPQGPFDIIAFLHGFGVCGPHHEDWRALFSASGSLRAEDIAVVVAFVACGASLTDNLSVLQAVVFGGEGLPSVLDMVCDKWDNWLLSDCVLRDTLESNVERTANEWGLECIAEGKFLWKTQHQYGRGPATEHGLGDAIDICARNVVADVMGPVVEAVSSRVSFGGRDNALRVLAGCAASLTDGAVRVAKTVLVQRVFDCLAV